jgi:hypothetical protein
MNKKGNIFGVAIWRVMAHCALILYFFSSFLHGMTTREHTVSKQIETARAQAEQDAIKMGKTALEVRSAGRTGAKQEVAKIQAEWAEQQARQQSSGTYDSGSVLRKGGANQGKLVQAQENKNKSKEKKEEEKEPENPALLASVPAIPAQEEQDTESREERNWAARYEDQTEQRFRVPARFDDQPILHFGDYMVAWDEEQRRNRVLLCEDDPYSCTLETQDTIYIYTLQGDYWVLSNSLDK